MMINFITQASVKIPKKLTTVFNNIADALPTGSCYILHRKAPLPECKFYLN